MGSYGKLHRGDVDTWAGRGPTQLSSQPRQCTGTKPSSRRPHDRTETPGKSHHITPPPIPRPDPARLEPTAPRLGSSRRPKLTSVGFLPLSTYICWERNFLYRRDTSTRDMLLRKQDTRTWNFSMFEENDFNKEVFVK